MNPFDTITGLPVHPLAVHVPVVLWPLGVLALITIVVVPTLRAACGWPVVGLLVVAGASVWAARISGEQLAHRIGEPETHAEYADLLGVLVVVTLAFTLVWWWLERRRMTAAFGRHARVLTPRRTDERGTGPSATRTGDGAPSGRRLRDPTGATALRGHHQPMLIRVLGTAATLFGAASLVMTVLVGHTGAEAAWSGRLASGASPQMSGAAATSYSMADVAQHDEPRSCWAVVDGGVYDLTTWIGSHPGGPEPIKGLCGTDGTKAFTAKHGEDGPKGAPQQQLARLRIGTLKG